MFRLSFLRLRTRLMLLFISMLLPPLILIVYGEWVFANTPAAGSMIAIGVTSLVVFAILWLWMARVNVLFVQRLVQTTHELAQGNLTAYKPESIPYTENEYGAISRALDELAERLQQREMEAQQAQTELAGILDIAADAIIATDPQQRVILFNQGAEKIFGYAAKEIIGQPLNVLLPNRFTENHSRHIESFAAAREAARRMGERREVFGRRKNGEEFPAEASISKLILGGKITYTAILRDISERKRAEEKLQRAYNELEVRVQERTAELRESQTQLQDLFDNASDLIQSVSPQGHFLFVNRAWRDTLGYGDSDLARLTLFDIIHPDSQAHCSAIFNTLLNKQIAQRLEATFLTKDGRSIILEGDANSRFENGKPIATRTILRDITQRRRAEEETRKAIEREKELGELKLRFVSMASHEFRTPLSVILSSAELLENYGDEWDRPRKEKHYRRIEAGVQQMTQMLNDVLLIGKAEAGKIIFAPKPLNLTQLCRAIADEMRASVGAEHTLQLQLADECVDAHGDEKLLRQILLNLLTNAFKYSPKGSTVKFDLTCHESLATFAIQDQGIGIPAPDQARLFDTFHRAKNVGNIPGTGLGLAIVKTSVDLHGGTIQFESQVDGGTKFVVTIPVSKT